MRNPRNPVARLMTLGEYEERFSMGQSARDPALPVWVVQVEGESRDAGIVPPEERSDFSYAVVVMDAHAGAVVGTSHRIDPIFSAQP